MILLQTFLIAFVFSFLGSIPPGTLNMTMLRLGLEQKMDVAWRFGIAAALIEYPYAWLALIFEDWITASPALVNYFTLMCAVVMTILGVATLRTARKPTPVFTPVHESGFRKGLVLSILNPLAMPFWIGITAYLRNEDWITLSTTGQVHSYLLGISCGAFALLILVASLSKKAATVFTGDRIKYIPGIVLMALGIYAFVRYWISPG